MMKSLVYLGIAEPMKPTPTTSLVEELLPNLEIIGEARMAQLRLKPSPSYKGSGKLE